VGGVSAAVSKTAAAPIERVKLLVQNQVSIHTVTINSQSFSMAEAFGAEGEMGFLPE
jgi:hypothetical protein